MHTSLLLCFAIAATSVSAVSIRLKQDPETICLGQENFLRIQAEGSCLQYYQCYGGRAYLMQCPTDTWFNENEQICDTENTPVGCELEVDSEPSPEPEPDTDKTEESEENEEDSETQEKEDVSDDGSGDLVQLARRTNQHDQGEEQLEQRIIELFKAFLIKLQEENDVDLTNGENDFEETFVNVMRSYRRSRQADIENETTAVGSEDQIPELQVEDDQYDNENLNPRVVKFANAYQVYKQKDVAEKDASNLELEDEDLIRIFVNELQNQKNYELSRHKRQAEGDEETDDGEDENTEIDDDKDENIDEEEEEESKVDENIDEQEPNTEGDENFDETQDEEFNGNEVNESEVEAETPDDVEEAVETPIESVDDETRKRHHHHQTDDLSVLDILQESEVNKDSKDKSFFKRLFRSGA